MGSSVLEDLLRTASSCGDVLQTATPVDDLLQTAADQGVAKAPPEEIVSCCRLETKRDARL